MSDIGQGTLGTILQGQGTASPKFSTATYPSIATGTGTLLRANGTNWVATTATFPDTAGTSGNVLTSNGTNWTSVAPITNVAVTSFTPILNFGGATTGIAYTTQAGKYIRVGSFVFFEISITLSSKGSATGAATITGLPLTSNASSLRSVVTFVFNFSFNAYPTSTVSVFGYINNNSTVINIAANASGVNAANVTDTTFQNGSDFTITGSYMV